MLGGARHAQGGGEGSGGLARRTFLSPLSFGAWPKERGKDLQGTDTEMVIENPSAAHER